MEEDYTPSLLDWLAFMSCLLWNPVLLAAIICDIQKEVVNQNIDQG